MPHILDFHCKCIAVNIIFVCFDKLRDESIHYATDGVHKVVLHIPLRTSCDSVHWIQYDSSFKWRIISLNKKKIACIYTMHVKLITSDSQLAVVRKHKPCALRSEVINQINKYLGLTTLQPLLSSPRSQQDPHCSKATGVQQPISEICKRSLFKRVYWPFCTRTNTDLIPIGTRVIAQILALEVCSQCIKMQNAYTVLFLLWTMQDAGSGMGKNHVRTSFNLTAAFEKCKRNGQRCSSRVC